MLLHIELHLHYAAFKSNFTISLLLCLDSGRSSQYQWYTQSALDIKQTFITNFVPLASITAKITAVKQTDRLTNRAAATFSGTLVHVFKAPFVITLL